MTEEEIIEGNKLIAEFISYNKYDCQHGSKSGQPVFLDYYNIKKVPLNEDERDWHNENSLQFHLSWAWLMPVVEKIETGKYRVKICGRRCEIWKDPNNLNEEAIVPYSKEKTKIESVHMAVIKFINWYNTQQNGK